jgi:uncharacterized membrane protein YfcA
MSPEIPLVAVIAVVAAGSFVRGLFGFGEALLAMPLLALFLPLTVVTPLVAFLGPTLGLLILSREWRKVDLRGTLVLIASTLAGIPLGLFLLKRLDPRPMNILLALVIILFALVNLHRPARPRFGSDGPAVAFGFAAGILGAAYNTNGPPVVFYGMLRGWDPDRFRATLQGYFLPTGGAVLAGQGLAGLWTRAVLTTYLYALPFVLGAAALGLALGRRIPAHRFNKLVYAILLVLGAALLVKEL